MDNIAVEKELEFNFWGKCVGNRAIILSKEGLFLSSDKHPKDRYEKLLSFSDAKRFVSSDDGIFGSTVSIHNGQIFKEYKCLDGREAASFVKSVNEKIARQLEPYIISLIRDFNHRVVKNYPRDSHLDRIGVIVEELSEIYENTIKFKECFDDEVLHNKFKGIFEFRPVKQNRLGKCHEELNLKSREKFFDSIEANPLTHEQRLAVLRSNDKNLVLAAAGTGKTSVIVAKALDIIDRDLAKPSEILILAYNKSAAKELKDRLTDKSASAGMDLTELPNISTFHALGRQVLRQAGVPTYMSTFTEDSSSLEIWVTDWIINYLNEDSSRLVDFIKLFPEPINPFDIDSQEEYEKYVRDNEFRTLNGELVKGYQELLIANWMALNQIPYEYEARYITKQRIDIGFDYRPDFHIPQSTIYIEHFGISRNGDTRPDIDSTAYNQSIEKKRQLHKKHGTTLVETFHYDWMEGQLEERLKKRLISAGVVPNESAVEETLAELLKNLRESSLVANWSKVLIKALKIIRFEQLDEHGIQEKLSLAGISQVKKKTRILSDLHNAYVKKLLASDSIDFDDMIIRAISAVNNGQYVPKWKYILVDEFQDISTSRMSFVESIVNKGPNPSLTVVGDDWQSIYRFSGGRLELTTRFQDLVGPHSLTKLQKTFRYNNSIADIAGKFVMKNPEQYRKSIETHDIVDESQVYLFDDKPGEEKGIYKRVSEIVRKIREKDPQGSIAVIARYNYLLEDTSKFLREEGLNNVRLWSFHKSKGLEADYGILIGLSQGNTGFPNDNREDAISEALLPTIDSYPHSEERRLFYVGLTRSKKRSYLIANPTSPSEFIVELLDSDSEYKIKVCSDSFKKDSRSMFKCLNCTSGYLHLLEGPHGKFYRCSSGKACSAAKARVCTECGSPSFDQKYQSICNNPSCGNTIQICDLCGRPMKLRTGPYGEFWGCTGYGISDDKCKNTRKKSRSSTAVSS